MGDSGAEDTSDSLTESDLDQIERDAEAIQEGGKSNIVGSSSYDAQFTADNLESRGLDPENFMAPENFAQTTQGGFTGGTGPQETTINVPSVGAASSTLAPGILGETLSDFQSGVRDDSWAARGMVEGAITPESGPLNMLEAAIASRPRDFSDLDLIPTTGFLPAQVTRSDVTSPASAAIANVISDKMNQNVARKFGLGDPRGIDFGVTQQLLPTTTPTARPKNVRQRIEDAVIQEALDDELVKTEQDLDRPVISEYALGGLDPMLGARTRGTIPTEEIDDLADTEFARPRETGTTATGTFDPEAENLMDSTFLGTTPYKEGTAVADIKLRDAPFDENLNLFGLQIPNLAGRALNFASEKLNDRLFDAIVKKGGQALRDSEGRIIGAMDPTNSFLMEGMPGLDAKGQMRGQIQEEQGDGGEQVRRAPPKAPTDPCPDGYQLIDGKCTPTGATDTGTGFMMFPADRTPPFRTGPFTPTTVATNPNIRGLNPVTFGLSNIFRR